MISKIAFLAGATLVACQTPIKPSPEDLTATAQTNVIAEVNLRRGWHGTCSPVSWDQSIADRIKTWIVDGNNQCAGASPDPYTDSYSVWVTTYQIIPTPVWSPATAATEWYNRGAGTQFENMIWNSASKIGCAQCRDGFVDQGHMVFVYCTFADITGTAAANINPVNTTCDKCIGVTCAAPAACKQTGVCNPSTGVCEYLNVADGQACDDNDDTTANDVCTAGACAGTPKCNGVTCAPLDPACSDTGMCEPTTGKCIPNNKPDNTLCDDNNPATQNDKCVAGVCLGADLCATTPPCTAIDGCHLAGTCDPTTGKCTNPKKPTGTSCDDGNANTVHDACSDAGVCVGEDLCANVTCQAGDCIASATCNPATGACVETPKADGTQCDDGNIATFNDQCQNGACMGMSDGCVALDCKPDYTTCQATAYCIPATSATTPATCGYTYRAVGAACGNFPGYLCTQANSTVECLKPDLCTNKVCTNDQCTENGACDPSTGTCMFSDKMDGTPCDDGIAQTVQDACQAGVCVGKNLCAQTDCSSHSGKCTDSQCDPTTGMCITINKQNGTACDDGDDQTMNDMCNDNGVCEGTNKCASTQCVVDPPKQCVETQGVCDHATGSCTFQNKADGTACDDGDANTHNDHCMAGVCTSGTNCEIKLIRQFSHSPCVLGKSYGFTDAGKLFVNDGCRAKFKIVANDHELKCSSHNWKYTECDTYPLLPSCTNNDPEPCPTNTKCPGFTKLGDGHCVDQSGAQFNSVTKTVRSKPECIQLGRTYKDAVSGVEFSETTKKCTLLVPAGFPLPGQASSWDSKDETKNGVAPVVSTDNAKDVSCWIPEDRCLGVTCQAKDGCHVVGVCEPQTGMCTNPEMPDGSWCDDGDATTWGDKCTAGVCSGNSGSQECWRADSWWGTRSCKNDPAACIWGAGVYATEQECCDKSFHNGCQSQPTKECWVGDHHWPTRTCKKISDHGHCSMTSGCWKTEADCCAKGAAHKQGCHAQPDDDADDGVADRPEQCVCDQSLYGTNVDPTVEDYCASTSSPNGNGHICALPTRPGKCDKGYVFCRKAKSVPTSSSEVCACSALLKGAKNTHTRLCVDKTTNGQNMCYPSNSNGGCGVIQWSICVSKTSFSITINAGHVSSSVLVGHVSKMAGHKGGNNAVVSVVSSCKAGPTYGSRYAMKNAGCTMGGWRAPARHARSLGGDVEQQTVTMEWTGIPSSQVQDYERNLKVNLDIAKQPEEIRNVVLKDDPELAQAMKEFVTYALPEVTFGPAPTDESDEEINGDDDKKGFLWPLIASLIGLFLIAGVVAGVVMYKRRAQQTAPEYTAELVSHEEFTAEKNIALGNVTEEEAGVDKESLRV